MPGSLALSLLSQLGRKGAQGREERANLSSGSNRRTGSMQPFFFFAPSRGLCAAILPGILSSSARGKGALPLWLAKSRSRSARKAQLLVEPLSNRTAASEGIRPPQAFCKGARANAAVAKAAWALAPGDGDHVPGQPLSPAGSLLTAALRGSPPPRPAPAQKRQRQPRAARLRQIPPDDAP